MALAKSTMLLQLEFYRTSKEVKMCIEAAQDDLFDKFRITYRSIKLTNLKKISYLFLNVIFLHGVQSEEI